MPVEHIADEDLDVDAVRPIARPPFVDGRLRPWIQWFGLGRLVGAVVAVVVVVAAGWWLLRSPDQPTEAALPIATSAPSSSTAAAVVPTATSVAAGPIVVHVAGAVAVPGVYELGPGARVEAAIQAAGGTAAGADPAALNLAAVVADGERVYVPVVGETPPPIAAGAPPGSTAAPGPIDLNRADAGQLDGLPGVGPATARAIVDHRDRNGPFASVDDLEAVRGIGPAKLEAIRGLVTV
jgi:competence protein ComEA